MALDPLPSKTKRDAAGAPQPNVSGAADAPASPWVGRILEISILLLAFALAALIRLAWLETAVVTSGSMLPTLKVGDRVLVDHRASLRGTWARGDVVLFDSPETWAGTGEPLVKRVAGLPGETVALQNGALTVNGKTVAEPYLPGASNAADMPPELANTTPQVLAPGQYWVLGDNRANSDDSRANGPLPVEAIRGRVLRVLYPLGRGAIQ
jgi:signal peptidase I